jgi:type II secretory pathway pseudopilin PulG
MDTQALVQYVAKRLQSGVPKSEIVEELTALGWNENEIEGVYREAVISLGGPLPDIDNRPALARKAGAVDIVINFFSFILLGITATALGTLYFQVINHFFPDVLDTTAWYVAGASTDAIHYATAALFIGFPLYYAALRLWFRKFREDEGRVESKLSKWLTYIVLLVAAVTIVGDLITLVYTLLQGEITARFFLKALVILGLAGGIFGFYYLERRKIQYRANIPQYVFQRFGIGTSALVIVGIVLGFIVGGSPMSERDRSLDDTRSNHLSTLAGCIEQYAQSYQHLPAALDDFREYNEFNYCLSSMNDPETGEVYGYRIVTPSLLEGSMPVGEYELCAQFTLQSNTTQSATLYGGSSVWYEHGPGRSCDTAKAKLSPMNTLPMNQGVPVSPAPMVQIESSPGL